MITLKNGVSKKGNGTGSISQMKNNCLALQVALWEASDGLIEDIEVVKAIDEILLQLRKDAVLVRKFLLD